MTKPPDLQSVIRAWVTKAEHDRINAEHTLLMDPAVCPFDTVCFHAQQCAEKYIKALLTHRGVEFAKTHDLWELHSKLPKADRAPLTEAEAEILSDHAVLSRYVDEESVEAGEATEALAIALRVRNWVRSLLPKTTLL